MLIKGYCKTYRNLQLITDNKKQVTFKVTSDCRQTTIQTPQFVI